MPQVRAATQPTTLGRYTLIERIGMGGQGEVWRAHDESRGVDIALKILAPAAARHPAAWETLEREHSISSRLQHPGILQVLPPERVDDAVVLPMELAAGGDLRRLRGAGYLEIVPVLLEVAEALEYAHARGVVHRDLKSGNVLFDSRGRVKLADFGVAALLPAPGVSAQDARGTGLSPFTASPEQLRGEPPSAADDIYGLGALAYELLSGQPPYYPNFDLRRALTQPVPELVPMRQIPPELGEIVMRMLAKNAAQRPATMQQVMDELDTTLNATLSFAPEGAETSEADSPRAEENRAPAGQAARQQAPMPQAAMPSLKRDAEATPAPSTASARDVDPGRTPSEVETAKSAARPKSPESRAIPTPGGHTAPPAPTQRPAAGPASPTPIRPMHDAPRPALISPLWPGRAAQSGPVHGDSAVAPATAAAPAAYSGLAAAREAAAAAAAAASRRSARTVESGPVHALPSGPAHSTPTAADPWNLAPHRPVHAQPPPPQQQQPQQPQLPPPLPQPHRDESVTQTFAAEQTAGQDDPFDWEVSQPRLRAMPPPNRRPAPGYAGGRRGRHWPYLLSGLLCGALLICGATAAALYWLPREDLAHLQAVLANINPVASSTRTPASTPEKPTAPAAPAAKPAADPAAVVRLNTERADFDSKAADLAARGAAAWDAADFAAAKMQAAESSGAAAAGGVAIALQHLDQAQQLLASVSQKAPQALAAQLKAGDAALAAGHQQLASNAYALARRIDPNSQRAIDGARRARMLSGILPLLTDARKAEANREYSRAAQDYSQALALDPGNTTAKQGLGRANAAFGDDSYARAVGAGFAALGAGRLTEAQTDFQKALDVRPQGTEATEGLQRVSAALGASHMAALRQQAASLEAQERWRDAVAVYDTALRADPSLAFARKARARDEARAELSEGLQRIIDHPNELALPVVRDEAVTLLQQAREQTAAGPVLQSQVEHLGALLPQLERPVMLNMISDNATQVTIPSIGVLGSFGRREIRLKPGTYTVVGTRDGYRAVHQEFTVEPGQQSVTITVTCSEPI